MYIIETASLTKRFPKATALKDINLKIRKGSVFAILGPNGSGKSTFLKIIMGLLRPTSGKINVLGSSPSYKTKGKIAYVPEVNSLYRWMKVKEIMGFASKFYPTWSKEKEREILSFLELDPEIEISALSRGMQARLKIALALPWQSEILLLDEPLSGIDPPSRHRILQAIIREYRQGEQTIIFSTHIVKEAEKFFEEVVFLKQGEVTLQGEAEELRQEYNRGIEELFWEIF